MGDHSRDGFKDFPQVNPHLNRNPFVSIPPPPIPPRFNPPVKPPIMPPAPFPPAMCPNYPSYPEHRILPPGSIRPVYSPPSWISGTQYPTSNLLNQTPQKMEHATQDSKNPQNWIDEWVKNKGKPNVVDSGVKIYKIKEKLHAAVKLIRELENSSRTLSVMVKTVSSVEWEKKCNEVEEQKRELMNLFGEVKLTNVELKLLREKLSKRAKKRARLQRQSKRLKKQKEEDQIKAKNLNFQIDNWQKEVQEEVERVKREEELKKEADAVLWGVTQKKTEAKRQVSILSALLTLRSVRVTRLTAAGQTVSQSQIDTFNTVIERLKRMWSRQLEQCEEEEQALRAMLGVHTEPSLGHSAADPLRTHKRLVLNEWEAAILGSVGSLDSAPSGDHLISIRRDWDRFAVCGPSLLASPVPPGYVLPVPPSSDQWRSFLKY